MIGDYYQFYPKNGEQPKWDNLQERTLRIMRGGSFKENRQMTATYWRIGMLMEAKEYDVGFRCVAPLEEE